MGKSACNGRLDMFKNVSICGFSSAIFTNIPGLFGDVAFPIGNPEMRNQCLSCFSF